jgi:hypothetical protein
MRIRIILVSGDKLEYTHPRKIEGSSTHLVIHYTSVSQLECRKVVALPKIVTWSIVEKEGEDS